jgi:hypothetical protein
VIATLGEGSESAVRYLVAVFQEVRLPATLWRVATKALPVPRTIPPPVPRTPKANQVYGEEEVSLSNG